MLHIFGIFAPDFGKRGAEEEAPNKAVFFGGSPDTAFGAVPLSRAEQDACYLNGKAVEPDTFDMTAAGAYAAPNRDTR